MERRNPAPGSIFARDFRVVKKLKEGGMGAVFIVEQLSVQRFRALKLMSPELAAHPDFRRRFDQEAKVGGSNSQRSYRSCYTVGN